MTSAKGISIIVSIYEYQNFFIDVIDDFSRTKIYYFQKERVRIFEENVISFVIV